MLINAEEKEATDAARQAIWRIGSIGVGLIIIAAVGAILAFQFVSKERNRDLRAWQVRLGIVADSRAAAVDGWLTQQTHIMRELAQNAALQLYMTELALAGGQQGEVADEPAQISYLRNVLQVTAEREGYGGPGKAVVQANVARVGTAGLALLDATGRILVRTSQMPPLEGTVTEALARRKPGERLLIDLYSGPSGEATIGFVQPIYPVQADPSAQHEIGMIVGVRSVTDILRELLTQPGETVQTAETFLVRVSGPNLHYLSPLSDGTAPMKRQMALTTPALIEAALVQTPGTFTQGSDYAGNSVLGLSRALTEAPWFLIRTVGAAEALAETEYRGRVLLGTLLGAIALGCLAVLLAWRHGTSIRAEDSANRYRHVAARFERLSRFLKLVTNGQPTAIMALDGQGMTTFANQQAATLAGVEAADLIGKDLPAILGPARAAPLHSLNDAAREFVSPQTGLHVLPFDGMERVIKSDHIPLSNSEGYGEGGVLMVLEDLTELMHERARREQSLKQLVSTLVAVVDRRDPYSAHHSARVAAVARAIAEEMDLTPAEIETAEVAAALMNLGKIGISTELLTKASPLSEAELKMIRDSILASADLLEGIEFDGPVVETLRQMQEHWDGTGQPHGLRGEALLLAARVVAVANAFVGMVSARAYRAGLDFDKAARLLLDMAGTRFDRKPVTALINLIENRGMREQWSSFALPPAA